MLTKIPFFCLFIIVVNSLDLCQNSSSITKFFQKNSEVTVVYLVNSSCVSCHNEVKRLRDLRDSLRKIGVIFQLVVALDKKQRVDYRNVQINFKQIWDGLRPHAYSDHVYLFDRCDRLVYEVVRPWSQTRKPYIKAAILSTFHDQPCGRCPPGLTTFREHFLPTHPRVSNRISKDFGIENLPVDIVIMKEHLKEGSEKIHYYIERRVDAYENHNHKRKNYWTYSGPSGEMFQEENFVLLTESSEEKNHFKRGFIEIQDLETKEIGEQMRESDTRKEEMDYSSLEREQLNQDYMSLEMDSDSSNESKDFMIEDLDDEEKRKLPIIKEHYRNIFKWIKYDNSEEIA